MFKKAKEALEELQGNISYIKNTVIAIQKNLECKDIRKGYSVIAWTSNTPTQPAQVSFEVNYPDWLKLEKSEEWKSFLKLLRKRQNEYTQKRLQEHLDSQGMVW